MRIVLEGNNRKRFRDDLRAHRETFALNDAEYVDQILKISLNTFKKCLSSTEVLTLTRPTLLHIASHTGLNPKDYGLPVGIPGRNASLGGYDSDEYMFLCGRYFLYRRSFLSSENLNKSVLDILYNDGKACLSFHEQLHYVSDAGVPHEQSYRGDVYIDQDRATLSFLAFHAGQVRLTLITMPPRPAAKETIKLRGALLTHGMPRGFWQPTVSCVFADGHHQSKQVDAKSQCATIRPGSNEFERVASELLHAEENVCVITPLTWRKLHHIS